jgi:polysaccharide chain length determinant protein (PEP-CTERM system associated)
MNMMNVQSPVSQPGTVVLREYWSLILRRKWIIIASLLFSLTVAGILCKLLPKWYRSETLILVEDQKVPENVVKGIVEGNLEQRIFVIQKQIMSRTLLGEIVKELNLYSDEVALYNLDAAIGKVKSTIRVEMVAKGPQGNFVSRNSLDAFTVSFAHEDPATAMKVTTLLASKFIEENVKSREQIAEGTTEFLDYEVAAAKRDLNRKEDEITQFKAKHMGELPQQMEANLRALDRLQDDLQSANESIHRLSDRLAMVEKGIKDYERFGSTNLSLLAGRSEPDSLFRRLKELKEKLAKLNSEFWDTYPDVTLTQEEIRQVEGELVKLYGADAIKPGEKILDPYLQDLKKQQSELRTELTLLNQRQHSLQTEKRDYVRRVESAPAVEQELLILQRDYDNMKKNCEALIEKRLNARVAENLEKRQKGAQFRIIDPANFPRVPEKPNQLRILAFGLIFGCVLGIGIAVMKEQFNPQFRRPEDVEQALGPRLLAVIPDFTLLYTQLSRQRLLTNGNRSEERVRPAFWRQFLGDRESRLPFTMAIIVKWLPASLVAEQYRVAATRLELIGTKARSTVMAVTSAVKSEGKTTTVVNLGYTLARDLGKRTLLIDCDFKCPALDRYAETASIWGLADCLTSDIPVDQCLSSFEGVPCWIMPVGKRQLQMNELLKAERLRNIFAQLRERFEYILINTPPILPLADMNVLVGYADALLLVVRASSTPQQFVKRALSTFKVEVPIHVILNGVANESLPYYMAPYYQQDYTSEKVGPYSRMIE